MQELSLLKNERNCFMKKTIIKLDEISNRKPFKIPENYFEDFNARLESQFEIQTEIQTIKVNKMIKPWMYMAAMFTGILILGSVVTNVYNKNLIAKNENYELYMLSQINDDVIYEHYMNDNYQNDNRKTDKQD